MPEKSPSKNLLPTAALAVLLLRTSAANGEGFRATQFRFEQSEGANAVVLDWTRGPTDPTDLEVVENGRVVTRIKAISGTNTYELDGVASGSYTYEIRAVTGVIGSQAQTILPTRPEELGTPQDVECEPQSQQGLCELQVSWSATDPTPTYHDILLDGSFLLATADALTSTVTFPATTAGIHCVAVAAAVSLQSGGVTGRFRGLAVESCCEVPCGAEPCPAPTALSLAQVKFGPGAEENSVLARWESPSPYRVGTRILVNGSEVDLIDGGANSHVISRLASSRAYEIAVQGDCGTPSGTSSRAFDLIRLRSETPHTNPVAGDPTCDWVAANGGRTTVRWTAAEPSLFVDIHLIRDQERIFHARLGDAATSVTVDGTAATDAIELQFFAEQNGNVFGSQPLLCRPATGSLPRFTRGVCNGVGDRPNLTAAVFALNFLFSGGPAPPCLEACNVNGDGNLNLSDPVYLLNYLFRGESPPPAWGGADPICETATASADCAQAHPTCGET